jgi:hypothetical protein
MRRVLRAGLFVVVLSACGGSSGGPGTHTPEGGGGGGGSGGALVVTPGALTFTAVQNGPLPAPQSIHIHRDDLKVNFGSSFNSGYPPGWLQETSFAHVDTTVSDFDLDFAITTTDETPGTYTTNYDTRLTKPGYCAPTGGPCIPGDLVGQKTIVITYIVTAP